MKLEWAEVEKPDTWVTPGNTVYLKRDKNGCYVQYPNGMRKNLRDCSKGTFLSQLMLDGFKVLKHS